jgi:lipoprotein-anchoring transpeptidase ErfK/SrfK
MKFSTIGAFTAAVIGVAAAGAALLMSGEPEHAPAQAVPTAVEQAAVQPPAPAKPSVDERFVIKRILPIEGPIRYGEWHWDEAGVAPGPLVITVDLDARVLSVFRGGYEIAATAVLLGTQDKPTPTGVFPITQKSKDHVSNLYDAPMPYMQRLTDDGITLHATNVQNGYASHGCIGMPKDFAAKLFQITALGDKVYITRGKQVGLGDQIAS